ncbi:4-hydroxy-tetrahydrodipicolinate synthase [Rhynchospora pubera]|uniref:4-hydroxy-tetrahydrodipicolinate synthase n=1 Tax=Rhynchospora pubera TaxID=906938 RepID=A0AAV8BWZ5_9POAL|nr:4-hydroxy-tetrahydrodipicolinate synthase [Rhynchospora pubera]
MASGLLPKSSLGLRNPIATKVASKHHVQVVGASKRRTSVEEIRKLRLITAMKTPYLPDGRIDLEAYDEMVKVQIAIGAEGVIVGSHAGEGHVLSWDEHIMLIGHTANSFGESIRVIGCTGSNATGEAIRATELGFAVGMDAALQINPYCGKTSIQGIVAHLEAVLSLGPTIIYNVPGRTGQDIPAEAMHALARNSPNFVGVKECVGNERVRHHVEQGLVIWTGMDSDCYEAMRTCGAVGVTSVACNLVPRLMHELIFGGENVLLHEKLKPLFKWLSCEPNPLALNTALMQLGVIHPVFRLPYYPLPLEKRKEFIEIVKAIGRDNFVGEKDVQVLNDDDFILVGRY